MPVTIDGSNTPTAGGVGYGDGTELAFTTAGSAGQVLLSNGAGAPSFGAVPSVNLATGVTGTLPVGNGGTGATTLTSNNVILGNGGSAVQFVAPGTTGNVLTSNGTTWTSAAAPAGGFSNLTVFTSSGTWTIPAGVTKCKVIVTGAGGGANGNQSGGGGAGATAIKIVTLSGSTASITIGAESYGGNGGDSSFVNGATTVTGGGGFSGVSTNSQGGAGGSASGGDININGGGGGGANVLGGPGGSSFWGGGGPGSRNSTGADGNAYGSGATGSTSSSSTNYAGKAGVVVIEY